MSSEPRMFCGTMVVKLDGMAGGYAVDGLDVAMEAKRGNS